MDDAEVRRCPGCNRPVATTFCTHCGLDAQGRSSDPAISPQVAALLRRFNIGAGLGAGVWTFAHRAPVLGAMFWLSLLILPPVAVGIMVYLLINGNRVALQRRRFDSIEQFERVQRAWRPIGIVVGTLTLLVVCAQIVLIFAASSGAA